MHVPNAPCARTVALRHERGEKTPGKILRRPQETGVDRMRERIFFPSVFMALMMGLLIRTSAAWALIPVVPFSPQEDVSVMTENAVCTPCPVTTSRQVMNAATSISVTSASPTASASISLPAAGLPDLSVFAGNESGTSSTANAEYINTIRFVYTGSGPGSDGRSMRRSCPSPA